MAWVAEDMRLFFDDPEWACPDTMVAYEVDAYYSPADDRNLYWNDPALGIDRLVAECDAILSGNDKSAPLLDDLGRVFRSWNRGLLC